MELKDEGVDAIEVVYDSVRKPFKNGVYEMLRLRNNRAGA